MKQGLRTFVWLSLCLSAALAHACWSGVTPERPVEESDLLARQEKSWPMMRFARLVLESDLIVVGTLRDAAETEPGAGATGAGEGTIVVAEVLKGEARVGDRLTLRWSPEKSEASISHLKHQGKERLWYLVKQDGAFRADHPQRVAEPAEARRVRGYLLGEEGR